MSSNGIYRHRLPPRRPQVVMEELEDLARIENHLLSQPKETASYRLRLRSVTKRQLILKEELYAAWVVSSDNDMELSLEGHAVKGHMIDINFLGSFLVDLQKVTDKVVFSAGSQVKVAERVPKKHKLDSKLMLTGTRAASFTVQLKLVPLAQDPHNPWEYDRRQIALDNLEELLSDDTSDERVNMLVSTSACRTPYESLLGNIAYSDTFLRSRTRRNPYGVKLSPEKAATRLRQMEILEQDPTEETFEVTGILMGGSLGSNVFEIDTKGPYGYIEGEVDKEALDQMKIKLSALVHAKIFRITQPRTKLGLKPTIRNILQSIYELSPPKQGDLFE